MPKSVAQKTLEELEAMHTGSLMSRRKALLKCAESPELSAQAVPQSSGEIRFKNTAEWQRAYKDLKQVLSLRENVPNKQQRKAARQAAAKHRR